MNTTRVSIKSKINYYKNKFYALAQGMNTVNYWNARFRSNWVSSNGRLQTALFATGFALLNEDLEAASILDYGCGCGDSLPVLKMKYPDASLYFYDFSKEAMTYAHKFYSEIAKPIMVPSQDKYDLVYCSNVIEHVPDHIEFCRQLIELSKKYVVIQAPYDQRLHDGSLITLQNRPTNEEHMRTINKEMLDELGNLVDWKIRFLKIPYAWDLGEQIFFIGKIKR